MAQEADVAARLRAALVDELRTRGVIRSDAVERAFRTVPRHRFMPRTPVHRTYAADDPGFTRRRLRRIPVDSVSAPAVVALMVEQAGLRPGERVLAIGAGGYHAALLAELVGPDGAVATVDPDSGNTWRVTRRLSATGYGRVRVARRHQESIAGPFDVIMVMVAAWDIPPMCWKLLVEDGRLVVPLRMRGVTRSVALVRQTTRLVSTSVQDCGFLAARARGGLVERLLPVHGRDVFLRYDHSPAPAPQPTLTSPQLAAMGAALQRPPVQVWSQVMGMPGEAFSDLDLWLMATLPGFYLLTTSQQAVATGIVDPTCPTGTPATTNGGSLAYLAKPRPVGTQLEYGAYGHGPQGQQLARQLVEQIRLWHERHRAGPGATITVHSADMPDEYLPQPRTLVLDKTATRVVISWP